MPIVNVIDRRTDSHNPAVDVVVQQGYTQNGRGGPSYAEDPRAPSVLTLGDTTVAAAIAAVDARHPDTPMVLFLYDQGSRPAE